MIPLPHNRTIWIEFKREGEVPTPLQEECHEYLRSMGHKVLVTSDSDEALKFVRDEMKRSGK